MTAIPLWQTICALFSLIRPMKSMSDEKQTPGTTDPTAEEQKTAAQENGTEAPKKVKGSAKKKRKSGKDKEKLHELEQQIAELKDKHLRLFAEFDNYKKRTVKEKLDLMRTAAQDTLASLLPVLDDFDRAKKISDDPGTEEHFTEGVDLVYQKLYFTLKGLGLQEMETNGNAFDPEHHEAISEIPAPSEDLKGKIVDTVEKGYFLHDKIIRHAKVVIGR
jgi:molecular chaperone GrpE